MRIEDHSDHVPVPRRPTSEDVRAYMDFLAEEHPLLLKAISRVAETFVETAERQDAD